MKKLFLILLLFVFMLDVHAQDTKQNFSFSLEQAIEYAQKYNRTAINSGRDIESANQRKWETTAAGLPQIDANLSYQNNFSFMQQGVTGGGPFGGNPGSISTFAFGSHI